MSDLLYWEKLADDQWGRLDDAEWALLASEPAATTTTTTTSTAGMTFFDRMLSMGSPLIAEKLGESITYHPAAGGPPRTITATIVETATYRDESTGITTASELLVTVERDPDSARGGIDDPRIGDGIVRASDPAGHGFSWTGEKQHACGTSWALRFARNVPTRVGGNTQSR